MPPWDKMLQRMTFCSAMLQSAAAELATIAGPPLQSWLISFLCPPTSKTALEQHGTTRWALLRAQWWMPSSMITTVLVWVSLTVHWDYCCLSNHKEPVLLLLSDQHSQSLAAWQFQELLLQQINPTCSHITIVFVCLCYSVLTWTSCVYPGLGSSLCWLDWNSWPSQTHRWLFSHYYPPLQTWDSPEFPPRCAFWALDRLLHTSRPPFTCTQNTDSNNNYPYGLPFSKGHFFCHIYISQQPW